MLKTDELRSQRLDRLIAPLVLLAQLPVSPALAENVTMSRNRIENILPGKDPRLLAIVGPCSIHDVDAALDYARQLATLRARYQDRLEIVMRTYFEKPRTVVGWKGLISDPALDGSYQVNHGLALARRLLLDINALGLPTATATNSTSDKWMCVPMCVNRYVRVRAPLQVLWWKAFWLKVSNRWLRRKRWFTVNRLPMAAWAGRTLKPCLHS